MLALRLFLNDIGLIISTREPADFRDKILPLGVTQMSAGSKTDPGGYSLKDSNSGKQFEVEDKGVLKNLLKCFNPKVIDPVLEEWGIGLVIFLGKNL